MALKVIGAGLGRTGTLSLKMALEQLGIGPCYHMVEVMMHPEAAALWIGAANGKPDWDAIFHGYAATVDYPGCSFWRELSAFYPDAKVLLSLRDPDQWFESTQATIFSAQAMEMIGRSPMKPFLEKTVWNEFGDRIHDRDFMVDAFRRHNAAVQQAIPKERLLVYEPGQGWEPICEFLGVPVPASPFPHANSREEMATIMSQHRDGAGPVDLARLQDTLRERFKKP